MTKDVDFLAIGGGLTNSTAAETLRKGSMKEVMQKGEDLYSRIRRIRKKEGKHD
ncbi:MAG: hypothetical protein HYW01_06490 [Deltaproteobacteria bacterium]|nr:hypothetical protein [Deltaproteobacteria bacterium]